MTTETLIILLGALLALSLVFHAAVIARYIRKRAAKKPEKNAEKQASAETRIGTAEINDEILLVLLTAAAAATLGNGKKSKFKVVSFRRANTEKKKGLYEYDKEA